MIPAGRGCGALVDWMLAAVGVMPGAAAFAVGHLIAIAPYLRNRRPKPTGSQQLLVALTVPLALVIAWALTKIAPADKMGAADGYSAIVAAMAACAGARRIPRSRTGCGAMLLLDSDLFIFGGEGGALQYYGMIWL